MKLILTAKTGNNEKFDNLFPIQIEIYSIGIYVSVFPCVFCFACVLFRNSETKEEKFFFFIANSSLNLLLFFFFSL